MAGKRDKKVRRVETDEERFRRIFPTPRARDVADQAIDDVGVTEPMTTFLDAWVRAYVAAGGKTTFKFD